MEGNKNRRPSTPSPSIKRTPTVKRGPVPPRVSRTESSSSKPQAARSSSITSGAPKVSSRSKTPPTGARSRASVAPTTKSKSKKTGLVIFLVIAIAIILSVLLIPFNDGKSILQIIASSNTVEREEEKQDEIVDPDELNTVPLAEDSLNKGTSTVDGEQSTELSLGDDGLLPVDDPVLPSSKGKEPTPASAPSSNATLSVDSDMLTSPSGRHYVILGSFKVKSNALNFKNKLGSSAKIIAPTAGSNLYKVSGSDFSSIEEANKQMENDMEKYGVDIWILTF